MGRMDGFFLFNSTISILSQNKYRINDENRKNVQHLSSTPVTTIAAGIIYGY